MINEYEFLRWRAKNDPKLQFTSAARRLHREIVRELRRLLMPVVIWLDVKVREE